MNQLRAITTRINGKSHDVRVLKSDNALLVVSTLDGVQNMIQVIKFAASEADKDNTMLDRLGEELRK